MQSGEERYPGEAAVLAGWCDQGPFAIHAVLCLVQFPSMFAGDSISIQSGDLLFESFPPVHQRIENYTQMFKYKVDRG